ncbi:hypothetical protein K438DRAFT_1983329 [Mycena galopus ATCC 62051]|nr:hypothetical protein K438DRAFT_1983329 [Mycena galopus ATCC 62051]
MFDNGEPSDLTSALRELVTPALCPRFRHLRLTHCDRTHEIHPVLKALTEARCAPSLANPNGAPLRRVELNLRCESTLLTTKFAAAIHPSEVTTSNLGESVVCVATLGIPEREREVQTYYLDGSTIRLFVKNRLSHQRSVTGLRPKCAARTLLLLRSLELGTLTRTHVRTNTLRGDSVAT